MSKHNGKACIPRKHMKQTHHQLSAYKLITAVDAKTTKPHMQIVLNKGQNVWKQYEKQSSSARISNDHLHERLQTWNIKLFVL